MLLKLLPNRSLKRTSGRWPGVASVSVVMSVLDFLKFEFVIALGAGDFAALEQIPLVCEYGLCAGVFVIMVSKVKRLAALWAIDVERPPQSGGLALGWCVGCCHVMRHF